MAKKNEFTGLKKEKWASGYAWVYRDKGRILSWGKTGQKDSRKGLATKLNVVLRATQKIKNDKSEVEQVGGNTYQVRNKNFKDNFAKYGYTASGNAAVIDIRTGKKIGTFDGMTRLKRSVVSTKQLTQEVEDNALRNAMVKKGLGIGGGSDPPEYYQAQLVGKLHFNRWVDKGALHNIF